MESSHCMGGAIAFLALFQQIYTIEVGVILSQSCTKSVTKYLSQNTQPRNNKQESDSFSLVIQRKLYLGVTDSTIRKRDGNH